MVSSSLDFGNCRIEVFIVTLVPKFDNSWNSYGKTQSVVNKSEIFDVDFLTSTYPDAFLIDNVTGRVSACCLRRVNTKENRN